MVMITQEGFVIAQGKRAYADGFVHKFGANHNVENGVYETIWSPGGLYPWSAFDDIQTLYANSTTADAGSLTLQGLDEDYNPLSETITMAGTGFVNTQSQFKRLFRALYTSSTTTNTGDILIRAGSSTGTIVAEVEADKGQTQMAIYTVPANTTAYGVHYLVGSGKSSETRVELYIRNPGESFRIQNAIEVSATAIDVPFPVPFPMGPKTDIDFRAFSANGGSAVVNFDLILQK